MHLIWRGARVALGAALIAAIAFGVLSQTDADVPLTVTSATSSMDLVEALSRPGSTEVEYADSLPPDREVAVILAGAAARGSRVVLNVPGTLPTLFVEPPANPVAKRRAALHLTLRGEPGETVAVTIEGPAGSADTLSLRIESSGVASAAVAVEAVRGGHASWTVRTAGVTATAEAWVRPEAAVRVLVLSGAPSWESRYLVRALETAGARVSVLQDLGRGQSVTTSGVSLPRRPSDLEDWDVVVSIDAGEAVPRSMLLEWVTERGGGLLIAGVVSFPSVRTARLELDAEALQWSGPAEIVPLPAAQVATLASAAASGGPGVPVASSRGGSAAREEVYASADWIGRGRVFTAGFESWPWVMEAGLVAEHGRYWESVVEWLAGGLSEDMSLVGGVGLPGVAWEGRVQGTTPAEPAEIELLRPIGDSDVLPIGDPDILSIGGSEIPSVGGPEIPSVGGPEIPSMGDPETLRLLPVEGGSSRLRFVPIHEGDHGFRTLDAEPGDGAHFGVPVLSADAAQTWTDAALTIGGAGGEIVRSVGVARQRSSILGDSTTRRWLLFLALAALAVAGWAARRIEGLS